MIEKRNFSSTRQPMSTIKYPKQFNSRCLIQNALKEQKYRRSSEIYSSDEAKDIVVFNQDKYLNRLGQLQINRHNQDLERHALCLNTSLGVDRKKNHLEVSLIQKQTTLKLRDISNIEVPQGPSLLENDFTLETPTSLFFNENESHNEWENLEIKAANTFDEDEGMYLLELEIKVPQNSS